MSTVTIVDSHTAGEPTRVVLDGGPDLGTGTLAQKAERFQSEFDHFRSGIVREPRGSDVLVGALLCEASVENDGCEFGVIFFNNVGYLGMCGHGMIGVVETLRHLGKLVPGKHRVDTPVGAVAVELHDSGVVTIENVASYRKEASVAVDVPELGKVVGDVAWGGNWFYLVKEPTFSIELSNASQLQTIASQIRTAINDAGYPQVDHVELFGEPQCDANSRNFVLCPGLQYDRSPCGTGTSAKLACLAADKRLQPGETWIQEGILGTSFRATFQWKEEKRRSIIPKITGRAYVTAESNLKMFPGDPFRWGIT